MLLLIVMIVKYSFIHLWNSFKRALDFSDVTDQKFKKKSVYINKVKLKKIEEADSFIVGTIPHLLK